MGITSFYFLIFVGVSLFIYWLAPHKFQWLVLLADSMVFYFASVKPYTFLYVLASVATAWGAALYFKKAGNKKKKQAVLALAVILNAGLLAVLKYTNMFLGTFWHMAGNSEWGETVRKPEMM